MAGSFDLSVLEGALEESAPLSVPDFAKLLTKDYTPKTTFRGLLLAPTGSGKSTYIRAVAAHLLKVGFLDLVLILHGPAAPSWVWTEFVGERVKCRRLSEESMKLAYNLVSRAAARTLVIIDDPIGFIRNNSAGLNAFVTAGRERNISIFIITHRANNEISPVIRNNLDVAILRDTNETSLKALVQDSHIMPRQNVKDVGDWLDSVTAAPNTFAAFLTRKRFQLLPAGEMEVSEPDEPIVERPAASNAELRSLQVKYSQTLEELNRLKDSIVHLRSMASLYESRRDICASCGEQEIRYLNRILRTYTDTGDLVDGRATPPRAEEVRFSERVHQRAIRGDNVSATVRSAPLRGTPPAPRPAPADDLADL